MNVLIIDDNLKFLEVASAAVESSGHQVTTARTIRQAEKHLSDSGIDVVFLEINVANEDGLAYLEQLNTGPFDGHIVALTENANIADAVESMSRGATTFIQKPIVPDQIKKILTDLEKSPDSETEIKEETKPVSNNKVLMKSHESAMQEVLDIVEKAARTDASILLLGPSGTGKTVMAKHIHSISNRSDKPLVTVSCPSLSRELLNSELFGYKKGAFTGAVQDSQGKVHAAEGGTLFLDEIGEMPLELQPKLLRLLQEQEYERLGDTITQKANIRLITATNRDIQKEVAEKRFREDLLFRLNVITIQMPALVNRKKDLPMLVDWFLNFYKTKHNRREMQLDDDARQIFYKYDWPGNLREMGNVMERCVILAENQTITKDDLPELIPGEDSQEIEIGSQVSLSSIEEAHIVKILEESDNLEEASDTLDIDKATLYRKRKKFGMT